MNFLADESIDRQIVERLRKEECSVLYVVDMDPCLSNGDVFILANQKKAILLTADKHFGEMVFHPKMINEGVILIRLAGLSPSRKAEVVALLEVTPHTTLVTLV